MPCNPIPGPAAQTPANAPSTQPAMPLPDPSPPDHNIAPSNDDPCLQRRRSKLRLVVIALVIGAVLIVVLPLKIPLPLCLLIAGSDLLAAAVIALYLRQNRPS